MTLSLIVVGATFYLLYWVVGGALLASVSYIRHMHIHKARFGCLFTLFSLICAVAATYSGYLLGQREITECMSEAVDLADQMTAVVGCGAIAFGLSGIIWFFLLGGLGMFSLFLSRSWNQSWMDTDPEED